MRISTSDERPTVSIQNGRPICLRISSDSAWSSSEKNGFGPGGGMSDERQEIDHQAQPLLRDLAQLRVVGVLRIALAITSISAAMSCTTRPTAAASPGSSAAP